jgi:hypothetical protein
MGQDVKARIERSEVETPDATESPAKGEQGSRVRGLQPTRHHRPIGLNFPLSLFWGRMDFKPAAER